MSVNCLNVKATPPSYFHYNRLFATNSVKNELPTFYCLTNDSLGIYISLANGWDNEHTTILLLNQTNRDLWWADQSYSAILTWYFPEQNEFREVIIPEDGYYFLGGWYNNTGSCNMDFDIIQVHFSNETHTQNTNNTYNNNTYYNETFNIYDTEDPANSEEGGIISFGWEFGIVAGVVVSVLIIKNRKVMQIRKFKR